MFTNHWELGGVLEVDNGLRSETMVWVDGWMDGWIDGINNEASY